MSPPQEGMFRSLVGSSGACSVRSLFESLRCSPSIARSAIAHAGAFAVKVPLPGRPDAGGWELMEFRDKLYLAICDCDFPQDRVERVGWEGLTEFHFSLSGPVSVSSDGASATGEDLTAVVCRMGPEASYRVTCARGRRRSVALLVQDSFINALTAGESEEFKRIDKDLKAVTAGEVYLFRLPINRKLVTLVESIIANPFDEQRRLIYAEAKCLELLCETMAVWSTQKSTSVSRLAIRPRDMAMFEKARELILSNLSENLGIRQLARSLGTNTSKLTVGFRAVYGVTINQFTLNARMDHALVLLAQQQVSVAEVAEAVGYQHQSSFTQAFTRHFGFLPSKARVMQDVEAAVAGAEPGR